MSGLFVHRLLDHYLFNSDMSGLFVHRLLDHYHMFNSGMSGLFVHWLLDHYLFNSGMSGLFVHWLLDHYLFNSCMSLYILNFLWVRHIILLDHVTSWVISSVAYFIAYCGLLCNVGGSFHRRRLISWLTASSSFIIYCNMLTHYVCVTL